MNDWKRKQINKRSTVSLKRDGITPWLFLMPSLLTVSVLVLFPFGDVVRRSFFSAMGGQFVGLKNYIDVFKNEAFQLAARNTAKFTLICIPSLLFFSLLLALLVDALKEQRGIFKTSFLIPMSIPVASVVLLWKTIFHENGLLNRLLSSMGLETVNWLNSGVAMAVLMTTYIWKNMGYNMVLWLSGITAISPALYESASLDGAGWLSSSIYLILLRCSEKLTCSRVVILMTIFICFNICLIIGLHDWILIKCVQELF